MTTPAPGNTVYVRNLEEKIKIPALIDGLRELFGECGPIVDIIAKRNLKAKGQAFIVFEDADSASAAIDELQGFDLFDKPMTLEFAKTPSDATVKAQGSEEDFENHKRKRLAEKERKQAAELAEKAQREKLKRPVAQEDERPGVKQQKMGGGLKSTARAGVVPDEYLPPNKILFVQNLPDEADLDELTELFSSYSGFKEVRLVPGRKGLAFVEYEAEAGAISAKEATAGRAMGEAGKPIKVTYQRQ